MSKTQVDPDTMKTKYWYPVILLPLRPASLTHKDPQRYKIIHGMHSIGGKEQWINLNFFGRIWYEDSENIQYYIFNRARYGFLPGPSFSKPG